MRSLFLMTSFLVLTACDAAQQPPAAPSPELSAQLNRAVEVLNTGEAGRLGPELTFTSATRSENALQLELSLEQNLAERVRGTSRGALANLVERDWRPTMCGVPQFRRIVDLGGEIETQFVDQFGRDLFNITTDHCPRA